MAFHHVKNLVDKVSYAESVYFEIKECHGLLQCEEPTVEVDTGIVSSISIF